VKEALKETHFFPFFCAFCHPRNCQNPFILKNALRGMAIMADGAGGGADGVRRNGSVPANVCWKLVVAPPAARDGCDLFWQPTQ
jgi:hypothetical protein